MAGSFQAPVAQVYLRDAELTFSAEHADVLHYEHALHLLMAVRRQSISIYSVPSSDQAPQVSRQDALSMCVCVRVSPLLLALQSFLYCLLTTANNSLTPLVAENGMVMVLQWLSYLQEVAITEGPPILAASLSLDGSLVALQRSSLRLEFVSCKNQNIFVQVQPLVLMEMIIFLIPDGRARLFWLIE